MSRQLRALLVTLFTGGLVFLGAAGPAFAAGPAADPTPSSFASFSPAPSTGDIAVPDSSSGIVDPSVGTVAPSGPAGPAAPSASSDLTVAINGINGKPSQSIVVLLTVTLLGVAPALLLMMTSFTKIIVVLGLTRNALGLQNTPPNQVLVGLALFLSLFVMGPVLSDVNKDGLQPYLSGQETASQAYTSGIKPLQTFMLDHTRQDELALVTKAAKRPLPANRNDVPISTLIPAFMLSELKAAFLIGFVIFIPFLVIDLVVSAVLMSLGMMMLPPVTVSLPFKLLLFVLVDGWGLVVTALLQSY